MIDGEMLFELEGEAPRVIRAGEAFWGPGRDVIHYQDANNRTDIPCSFVLTMLCVPGQPMREWVTDEELEERKDCASQVDWLGEFGIGSWLSTGRSSPGCSCGMELGGWRIRFLAQQ
jgi:hypothetical protein